MESTLYPLPYIMWFFSVLGYFQTGLLQKRGVLGVFNSLCAEKNKEKID